MKVTYVLAAAGLAAAQLGDLSSCAIGCLVPALASTGCSLTDLQCACSADNQAKIRASATTCLEKCTAAEQAQALAAANALCGGGVSGISSTTGASSTGSATGTSSATSVTGTTTGTTPTGSASSSVVVTSSSVSSGITTAVSTNGTQTTGGSSTTSKPTTSSNPGTNGAAAPAVGIVAALLGAAFAL